MKRIWLALIAVVLTSASFAQTKVYQTKTGKVKFYSSTKAEDIEAVNNQTDVKFATNGQLLFNLLIRGFVFPNALMQEHFNENYMESTKFPKAKFMGTIDNLALINFSKNGKYAVTTSGTLEIHGVKQDVKAIAGVVEVVDGKLKLSSKFKIKIKDYGIKGNYIGEKIANEIELTIDCILN